MMHQLEPFAQLDPGRYQRHPIHGTNRIWSETNCYVDIWVELLHAWGFDPVAALPFTLAIDFEGDQWTFFKFPAEDLHYLYGLDVHELAVWRPLVDHIEEQIRRGRPVLIELDSFYLPDTAGTAYRREHVKSTVAAVAIDVAATKLGYFHNQGYYTLEGADFENALRVHTPGDSDVLPPYVEFVKQSGPKANDWDLAQRSLRRLRVYLQRLPDVNPFEQFRLRFEADLSWLATRGLDTFHIYSFATLRQFGACYELAATYLHWLHEHTGEALDGPIDAFRRIAQNAKTLQFQLARAMSRHKPLDLSAIDTMGEMWQAAIAVLRDTFLIKNGEAWTR